MNLADQKDRLFFNDVIYKIYTTEDLDEMRYNFLEQLRIIVDYDSADFFLAQKMQNQETGLGAPVGYNCRALDSARYDAIDYSRDTLYNGRSMVYLETDIMPDAERIQTEYYQKVYLPNRWHFALQMTFARNHVFCGCVTLYRNKGRENYTREDVRMLDLLKEHMAYRLYMEQHRTVCREESAQAADDRLRISEASGVYGFTRRENELLESILKGTDNEQIADQYSISINTLKKHLINIYRKAGVKHRSQLMGMIRPD